MSAKIRRDDIRFRSHDGMWSFTFYDGRPNDADIKSITFSSNGSDINHNNIIWESKNVVSFRPSASQMFFEEKRMVSTSVDAAHFVSAQVNFDKVNMRVIKSEPYNTMGPNGTEYNGHFIVWQIRNGLRVTVTDKGSAIYRSLGLDLLELHKERDWFLQVKYVQFLVRDCQSMHTAEFDASKLIDITRGVFQSSLAETAQVFCGKQEQALLEENEAFDKEVASLLRQGVKVTISGPDGNTQHPGKMVLSFVLPTLGDRWGVEIRTKLRLDADRVFVDRLAARDPDNIQAWTATVVSFDKGMPIAIVNNKTSSRQENEMFNQVVHNVKITVVQNDNVRDRLARAVHNTAAVLKYEREEMTPIEQAQHPGVQLQVQMTPMLLDHPDVNLSSRPNQPFALVRGIASIRDIRLRPEWELIECNLHFLESLFYGRGGITGLHGPPGSGKTTLLAKAVGFARSYFSLDGKIVMAAHSNNATQVILEHLIRELPKFGLDPNREVLWLESAGARMRRTDLRFGRGVDADTDAFSLHTRVRATARSQPAQWRDFCDLDARIDRGEELSAAQKTRHDQDVRKLQDLVRNKYNIIVCTISTCGTSDVCSDRAGSKCSMLILDETSQCPIPAFLEAWHVMNPFRLVVAGDSSQLAPFARSQRAMSLWAKSPIALAERLGRDITPMLDMQFRMPENLYHATSHTHYMGRVSSHPSTIDRLEDLEILEKISRIEIDVDGKGRFKHLASNLLFLDIADAPEHAYPPSSKVNFGEAAVTEKLVRAMLYAGIRPSDIMNISTQEGGYQQCLRMREHVAAAEMEVRRVDISQGDERRVVIMNTVHSPPQEEFQTMGSMDKSYRQNVSTSRQRSALIVIGNPKCMHSSKIWHTWLHFGREGNPGTRCHYNITQRVQFRVGTVLFSVASTPHVA